MTGKGRQGGRARDAERSREALLRAGTELFARHGFHGTTVDRIAAKAKVNKAMISYYFGGKKGLYSAILAESFARAQERMAGIRESRRPADELFGEFVDAFAEIAARQPELPAMILHVALSGERDLDDRILPYPLEMFAITRGIIDRGVASGIFRRVDPFHTHVALVGALVFFLATAPFRDRLIAGGRIPARAGEQGGFVRHLRELFIHGLTRRGPRMRERRS